MTTPRTSELLRVMLEAEGVKVLQAADGVEALAVLEREPVDAVISDILMPRMDGYRLCYEVRASPRFFALPFIFYTATYTSPGDEKFSLELGADKFLEKPAPSQCRAGQPAGRLSATPLIPSRWPGGASASGADVDEGIQSSGWWPSWSRRTSNCCCTPPRWKPPPTP